MIRMESLIERGGPERSWIRTTGMARPAAREGGNIYVSRVCVSVQAVLWGGSGQ